MQLLNFICLLALSSHHSFLETLPQGDLDDKISLNKIDYARDSNGFTTFERFSMGSVGYQWGIGAYRNSQDDGHITFFLPDGQRSLLMYVGVNEFQGNANNTQKAPHLKVLLDGELVSSTAAWTHPRYGQHPIRVQLDIEGKKSLSFVFSAGATIGDPYLSTRAAKTTGSTSSGKQPTLLAPLDKAIVSGDSATLRWHAVDGAIAYGISIVSLKSRESLPATAPRIWSASVTEPSYAFSLKDVPNGQYLWSVIAFGSKEPIGSYSEEWLITVDR